LLDLNQNVPDIYMKTKFAQNSQYNYDIKDEIPYEYYHQP